MNSETNILNIKEPILINDILPPQENIELLKHLCTRDFKIQHEDQGGLESKFKSGILIFKIFVSLFIVF